MAVLVLRLVSALVLLWVAGFAWFAGVPPRAAPAGERADGVVVLTGAGGRVERGVALLRAGQARRLLISGVSPGVRPRELAARTGAPLALFDCCVDLGFNAIDTRSNAEETAAWARKHGYRSVRLVTSDYHMRRAELELLAELDPGVRVLAEPVPTANPSPRLMLREYTKYLVRRAARLRERL